MQEFKQVQGRTEPISDEALSELVELAKPIIKWLWENEPFHGTVNITGEGVLLTSDMFGAGFSPDDLDAIGIQRN